MARYNENMAEVIFAAVHPKLKQLIGKLSDDENLPMNEVVARILAEHFDKPELAKVPRKKMGRPRKTA